MTRRKKKVEETQEALKPVEVVQVKEAPKPKTVKCPLRGHHHDLPLISHPDRPDLVLARCGDRDVVQAPATESIRPVDPRMAGFTYVVPTFKGE
jgi:hypothetical protein